jgi:oxygen-independent coproporphyrinogen-3 oxidase
VYCDFSIAVRQRVPTHQYLETLGAEWDTRYPNSHFVLNTVYFGGGTPSKLGPEGVSRMMDLVRSRAAIQADAEVTLEANPEDVTPGAVRAWLASGVNRVSLGVQSLNDAVLAWMHRTHDAQTARRSIETLLEVGLRNVSVDLIFGVPRQLQRNWLDDVSAVLEFGVPHVSVYGLTVEEHTPLGRWVARRDVAEAPEEDFESEFLAAHQALESTGFEHYEVSNYGRPGYHSRHNWAYWDRRPYVGLGPSAHEFDGSTRRWNVAPYADWVDRVTHGRTPTAGQEQLDPDAQQAESVYLGLRTTRGVAINSEEHVDVEEWVRAGWATVDQGSILHLTASGWLRLDALATHLTLLRSRSYI